MHAQSKKEERTHPALTACESATCPCALLPADHTLDVNDAEATRQLLQNTTRHISSLKHSRLVTVNKYALCFSSLLLSVMVDLFADILCKRSVQLREKRCD